MLIVSNDIKSVENTKTYPFSRFKMKDLGDVDTILGIKVRKHTRDYALC